MPAFIWSVIKIAIGVYVGLSLWLYLKQSEYVYHPRRKIGATPADIKLHYDDVLLKTQDGESIAAWYVPCGNYDGSGKAVIICHGNAGNIGDRIDTVAMFNRIGLDVLVFDYRGFGASTGKPTEQGTFFDALACWNYLKGEKSILPENIVIYGESLGGAVAAWLTEQVKPGALILESTFTSLPDMAQDLYPVLPARILCKFKYDTLGRLPKIKTPVIIAHSETDDLVPFKHGEKLYTAAHEPKTFIKMTGGHNSGGLAFNAEYRQAVSGFLFQHVWPNTKSAN